MSGSVTYKFRVIRLTYRELWWLGHGSFGFALLLLAKLLRQSKFDQVQTMHFAPILAPESSISEPLRPHFDATKHAFAAQGFRLLGVDALGAGVGAYPAYFVRGPILAIFMLSEPLRYAVLYSFPSGARPIATANGHAYVDTSPLFDVLLLPRASIELLSTKHAARIEHAKLSDISDKEALAHLVELARRGYDYNVSRGVFIPQAA